MTHIKRGAFGNPWLVFLPFLLLYVVIVFLFHREALEGDELRYFMFAENILDGSYYKPEGIQRLWNGPGYPLVIVPIVYFKLPLITAGLMNAFFQYASVVYLYKNLRLLTMYKVALGLSVFWGFYFLAYEEIPDMLTEPLTVFLITLFVYGVHKIYLQPRRRDIFLTGLLFAFLILTKVIFGYVWLLLLGIFGAIFLLKRKLDLSSQNFSRNIFFLLLVALIGITPYLIYTYTISRKVFMLADSGGMSLYCMSTPFEKEYGNWFNLPVMRTRDSSSMSEGYRELLRNHKPAMDYVDKFEGLERDHAYKELAFKNIRNHPVKYVRNIISNAGRLLFNFPVSYQVQSDKAMIRIVINSFFLVGILAALFIYIYRFRLYNLFDHYLSSFIGFYFGITLLLSAYPRFFNVMVPILICWIMLVIGRGVQVTWRKKNGSLKS